MTQINPLILIIIAVWMISKLNIYWDKDLLEPSTKPFRNASKLAQAKKH